MKVDAEYATKVLAKGIGAVTTDNKIGYLNLNEIAQDVLVFLAFGAEMFVPFAGPVLASLILLVGPLLFPNEPSNTWNQMREPIEALIDSQISDYHLQTLQANIEGFASNMAAFQSVWNDYENAKGDDKERQGEILRDHHISFLAVIRTAVPDFQLEEYAVASLLMFSNVANMHLALLADGIKHGLEWGYTSAFINDTLQTEFDGLTASGKDARALTAPAVVTSRQTKTELDMLHDAIEHGEALGWPSVLLDTWKAAYNESVSQTGGHAKRATVDYPTYAKQTYLQGRPQVKPYQVDESEDNQDDALALRALADYDAAMIINLLNYAELWPYLTGQEKVPDSSMEIVDREVWSGPFGRYTDYVTWDNSTTPPITPRGDNVTAIRVRAWDDVDGLQVKYGEDWGQFFGSTDGGAENVVELATDEFIFGVNVGWDYKLGHVLLNTTKNVYGPYGHDLFAKYNNTVGHEGYALSSMYITNWEASTPPGCEGIFMGFRPLLFG